MILVSTKERILQYLEYKSVTRSKFYELTGIKRGLLDTDKLKSAISDSHLAIIVAHFKDLNLEWAITGNGKMLLDNTLKSLKTDSHKGIPLIPLGAMAGALTGDTSLIMEYECEYYSIPMFRGAEFLISVKGDSMIPKYYSGDVVACKRLPIDTFFQWNRVYVVDTEQGVLIKKIQEGKDDDHILLVSENNDYKPFQLHRSSIYSIALVLGVVRAE